MGEITSKNLKTHDLPRYFTDGEVWTCVRDPANWLASVWAWMERTAWRRYPHQVPWHSFVDYINCYKARWPKFLENMTQKTPGVVGWFYGMYTPPGVNAYKLGPEIYQKLREVGGDPDSIGVLVNKGANVPVPTDDQRNLVYNAEKATYERYGFEIPLSYIGDPK